MTNTFSKLASNSGSNHGGIPELSAVHHIAMGRGGKANHHNGNDIFRAIVLSCKKNYLQATQRADKCAINRMVLDEVQARGMIFMEKLGELWYPVVSMKRIRKKVSQALREKAPAFRQQSGIVKPLTRPANKKKVSKARPLISARGSTSRLRKTNAARSVSPEPGRMAVAVVTPERPSFTSNLRDLGQLHNHGIAQDGLSVVSLESAKVSASYPRRDSMGSTTSSIDTASVLGHHDATSTRESSFGNNTASSMEGTTLSFAGNNDDNNAFLDPLWEYSDLNHSLDLDRWFQYDYDDMLENTFFDDVLELNILFDD